MGEWGKKSTLASMKASETADGNEREAIVLQQMGNRCLVELPAGKGVDQPRRMLIEAAQLQQILVPLNGILHGAVVLPQGHHDESKD